MEHKGDSSNPMTLNRHILSFQQHHKEATGDFTLLLTSIATACKYISSKVRRAGLFNLYGQAGNTNATGDDQKKLDVLSNEVFINTLKGSSKCAILLSEEEESPVLVETELQGRYIVAFDPLDGSSNIDANVSIGSIFGIWKKITPDSEKLTDDDIMQKGTQQIAAGYCLYGSSTEMVLCIENNVNCYSLDPSIGEFLLTKSQIQIPKKGAIYSINEGNAAIWDDPITEYVKNKKFPENKKPYSLRYIGSMVADVHRTILYGGIFLYPTDKKNLNGKLRLLYEAAPLSLVVEAAGGKASTGRQRILDIQPKTIHEKCGVILGSYDDVAEVEKLYLKYKKND